MSAYCERSDCNPETCGHSSHRRPKVVCRLGLPESVCQCKPKPKATNTVGRDDSGILRFDQ